MRLARLTAPATLSLALLAAPIAATAQPARTYRIGVLANLPPPPAPVSVEFRNATRQGLEDGGFVEGRNLAIEFRWEPDTGALSRHAVELAQSGVDAILAFTTPATRAVASATRTTPIVFSMVSDPIGSGFVASLARPGGHITGVTNVFPDLSGKLLELLREAVPSVKRTAVLWNPDNPGKALDYKELESAAQRAGVRVESYHVRARADFVPVFTVIGRERPDALIVLSETLTYVHRNEIAEFGLQHRIPTAFNLAGHVEVGGLMAFSPYAPAMHRRAGALVARVLAGARPADLPVEQPTTFRFAVNLKTAKALGLTIPPSVLARADEIIQ